MVYSLKKDSLINVPERYLRDKGTEMKSRISASLSIPFLITFMTRTIETKLVPEYNLKALDDYEVIKDEYKILYKEHLYSLKVQIDNFVNQNELVLFETYTRLAEMLNNTKIDASGKVIYDSVPDFC